MQTIKFESEPVNDCCSYQTLCLKVADMDAHKGQNLILDVPHEILCEYLSYMDVKTSIMFMSTCKKTNAIDKPPILNGQDDVPKPSTKKIIKALSNIIYDYSNVLKSVYDYLVNDITRDEMMANMLRKLIYISVSNETHYMEATSSVAFEQCHAEYNRLFMYFVEQMEINLVQFNNLLEDAQFEFRGFSIINISNERRLQLDTFKHLLKSMYFRGLYTVQTSISYVGSCMELYYDGEYFVFDIHRHPDEETEGMLIYFQDVVNDWKETAIGRVKEAFDHAEITIAHERLQWPVPNYLAPPVIAELIMNLMPNPNFFKGGIVNKIDIWNSIIEDNWLLNEVIAETMERSKYEVRLIHVSFQIMDAFTSN